METASLIMFWATVLSPIVGVIAIIVALIIAHGTSKDVKSQIEAINKQMDIFIAAQNPNMMEMKRQYEEQLAQLNYQVQEAEDDLNTVHYPFFGRGGIRGEDLIAIQETKERQRKLLSLIEERKKIETHLSSINTYLEKVSE